MRNAFKLLPVVVRVANSVGVDYSMARVGQKREVDLTLVIRGNLFSKFPALGRTIYTNSIEANRLIRC